MACLYNLSCVLMVDFRNQKLKILSSQHSTLLEITGQLSSTIALSDLLQTQHSKIRSLMKSDRATIWLCDDDKQQLVTSVADGVKEIRIPIHAGVVGYAVRTSRIYNIPDAYKDARFSKVIDKQTGYRTKTILVVPMQDFNSKVQRG